MYLFVYSKDLAHAVMEAEESMICHLQAGDPGELVVSFNGSPKA